MGDHPWSGPLNLALIHKPAPAAKVRRKTEKEETDQLAGARCCRHGRQDTRARYQGSAASPRRAFLCRVEGPDSNEGGLLFPNPERYEAGPGRLNFDSTRSDKGLVRRTPAEPSPFFLAPVSTTRRTNSVGRSIFSLLDKSAKLPQVPRSGARTRGHF